jgi:hypothetical protein
VRRDGARGQAGRTRQRLARGEQALRGGRGAAGVVGRARRGGRGGAGQPRDEILPRSVTYFGSGASGVLVKNDQMICEALGVFPTGGGKLWPPVL